VRFIFPIIAAVVVGASIAAVGFTFVFAHGTSYLSNDPAACANCHIMTEQYDAWSRGSHHAVAVCNDCHAPHDLIGKYTTKAINGWNHSKAFTTGNFVEPIQITARNRAITEHACRSCHADLVQMIDANHRPGGELACLRCHASVGHMQ